MTVRMSIFIDDTSLVSLLEANAYLHIRTLGSEQRECWQDQAKVSRHNSSTQGRKESALNRTRWHWVVLQCVRAAVYVPKYGKYAM